MWRVDMGDFITEAIARHQTGSDRIQFPPGDAAELHRGHHSPSTVTITWRVWGARRCSHRKIPCHVPRSNRPSAKGTDSLVRVSAILMWLGISSAFKRVGE